MGYETINFIPHQYTFLVFLSFTALASILFAVLIKCTVRNYTKPICRKIGVRLPNANFFGRILLRVFLLTSLELFVSCYVGFKSVQSLDEELDRSTADGVSVILAVGLLACYFPVIARMSWVVLGNFNDLADDDIIEKYGYFFVDLDILRRG